MKKQWELHELWEMVMQMQENMRTEQNVTIQSQA